MSATVAEAPARRRTARGAPKTTSDKTKAERKLAYMLCAPAVFVMLAVTAYPIIYADYQPGDNIVGFISSKLLPGSVGSIRRPRAPRVIV